MFWQKKIILKLPNTSQRYEWVAKGFTIDVMIDIKQGMPGSNMVSIYMPRYGGWILGTPKMFKTKKEASNFISYAKTQIGKGKYGKRVPFPR